MFKEIVDDARRTPDIGRSQKLTMSTLCSGELKKFWAKSSSCLGLIFSNKGPIFLSPNLLPLNKCNPS